MKHLTKKLLTMKIVLLATLACGESPTAPPTMPPGDPYDLIQDGEDIPRPPDSVWASTTDGEADPSGRITQPDRGGALT